MAVEVHKFSPVLASLSFDLELFGLGELPPRLTGTLNGPDLNLRWPASTNADYILVSGTNLAQTATWTRLTGPYLLNGGFYEYREPMVESRTASYYRLLYVSPAAGWNLNPASAANGLALPWAAGTAGLNLHATTKPLPADASQAAAGACPSAK